MPGALINLIAVGVQDAYITGNPTITFFKALYRRHTNFALEAIEQTFSGMVDFGRQNVSATVARNGDLISRVYVKATVKLTQSGAGRSAFVRNLGHAMLRNYDVLIGGATIDKQSGDWMTMKNSLTMGGGQGDGYDRMVGNVPELTELKDRQGSSTEYTIYVPLNFWFCNSYSQALPIIALQYHDVRFSFDFRDASKLVCTEGGCSVAASITDASLLIDYVLLDTQERKLFATQPHEMLIEQLQYPTAEPFNESSKKCRLTLNHPCKHVTWGLRLNKWIEGKEFLAYHPTDYMVAKRRAAELIYLLSLDVVTDTDGTMSVKTNDNKIELKTWSNADLAAFLTEMKDKSIVMTQDGELPDSFKANPFAHIEFLDTDFLNSDALDRVMATPVDVLGVKDAAMKFKTLDGDASAFFVKVHMYDNFGTTLDGRNNTVDKAVIQINGQDRFSERDGNYFNYVQPFQHWPNTPADGINSYSFALKPSEYQPSGTLNFSRVDYATLNIESKEAGVDSAHASLSYYAVNYNILRVLGGMGGLAYSNIPRVAVFETAMDELEWA